MRIARVLFWVSCLLPPAGLLAIFRPIGSWPSGGMVPFIAIAALLGWIACVYFVFRTIGIPRRLLTVAWLVMAATPVATAVFGRYPLYVFGYSMPWVVELKWRFLGVLLLFVFLALIRLCVRADAKPAAAQFTVESEHPEHVLNVECGSAPAPSNPHTEASR